MAASFLPRGLRDFDAITMRRRGYLLDTIKAAFESCGFMPLATPAMEQLDTLMGKYGDEGERLLFKVLNSGDFLAKVTSEDWAGGSNRVAYKVARKGLRYDLTLPLARYVVQQGHDLTLPFKRYQVQPVWRADRPQRGRYREFCQCDADVIGGGESLFYEAEMLAFVHDIFDKLHLPGHRIVLNHRQLLVAISKMFGVRGELRMICTILDKLPKVGVDSVKEALRAVGVQATTLEQMAWLWEAPDDDFLRGHEMLKEMLVGIPEAAIALGELREIYDHVMALGAGMPKVVLVPTLARGMDYYTDAIFEVEVPGSGLGSLAAGGRYGDLVATLGGEKLVGVGLSFGVERLYDLLLERSLFPTALRACSSKVLWVPMGTAQVTVTAGCLGRMRAQGIAAELYPPGGKLKKALRYASKQAIPWVVIIGEKEVAAGCATLKNMASGRQHSVAIEEVSAFLKHGEGSFG